MQHPLHVHHPQPPQVHQGAHAIAHVNHNARHGRNNCNGNDSSHHHTQAAHHSTLPKHIPIPNIPRDGDVLFEFIMFMFSAVCCALQFLIIYRSVFWLPYSFNNFALNVQLIDFHLLVFIGVILMRRLVYTMIARVGQAYISSVLWPAARKVIQFIMLGWVGLVILFCLYNIMHTHPVVKLFYLCYPLSLYFILFGLTVGPFFDLTIFPVSKPDQQSKSFLSYDGSPLHNCSTSPEAIREEVDVLKSDINNRMKQVLFNSVFSAYYAGFIPCCFATTLMYYETYWATFHILWLWLGSFVLYLTHCFPVRYCDVMHRCALHLGRWHRLIMPHSNVHWTGNKLWPYESVVKHYDKLYQALNSTNAAEPGNQVHNRFYDLFQNPTRIYLVVLTMHMLMILIQLIQLATASEWYQAVSMASVLFFNYYTLYKLLRDLLISHRVYKAERIVKDRENS
ncbi:Transmembrane protein 39A [Frankliniella fusca]|uniref:Transmembrane protein 39A n=1 Tax=Frankliniella fusca TaxID=407009 RepID=A0AAE1H5W0_9NEOP|nr:Transmembrane protein 39A [Frankliniella fusca]